MIKEERGVIIGGHLMGWVVKISKLEEISGDGMKRNFTTNSIMHK